MTWTWPGPSSLGYALTTAGMILFWTLVIFGAIVVMHRLGRENLPAPAVGQPGPASGPPSDPAPSSDVEG